MSDKDQMFRDGVHLMRQFCAFNQIPAPEVEELSPKQRNYHIGTCAYYRPTTIHVMVGKCAARGMGGRAWSWPGYKVDRTPYGVVQHETGHHIDHLRTGEGVTKENLLSRLFSKRLHDSAGGEAPLTGYLGTDKHEATFFMEWFAENFRLFVTNPGLSEALRPRFFNAAIAASLFPLHDQGWEMVLTQHGAPARIVEQARKQISARK